MASTLKGVRSFSAPCPGMQLGESDFVREFHKSGFLKGVKWDLT